jgi:hypothetical protein
MQMLLDHHGLEIIVLEKGTVLEAVDFTIFAHNAGVGGWIMTSLHGSDHAIGESSVVNQSIIVVIASEHLIDVSWIERLADEWCVREARAIRKLFGGAVGVGQVIVDGNCKGAWSEENFLERVLVIKTGHLEQIDQVFAVINETINHRGTCHAVGSVHEDRAETDVVKKLCVEMENGFGSRLHWPVHSEHDWLVDKSWMCVG